MTPGNVPCHRTERHPLLKSLQAKTPVKTDGGKNPMKDDCCYLKNISVKLLTLQTKMITSDQHFGILPLTIFNFRLPPFF